MQFVVVQRVMGLLLMLFSVSFVPPLAVALGYADGAALAFALALAITLVAGALLWLPVRAQRAELRVRDGFMIVTLFWTLLALAGSLPFLISAEPRLTFTDAFFESISGFTTTGATVLSGIDALPASIRYYRQQLQWFGGMGIVVLAVAVTPMLGVGGMQLYKAEMPGPLKETKLTPRIAETAKALWYIYLGLTVVCAASYWAAGMDLFDAIGHSFSTIAIGGFSTHDSSLGYFDNAAIDMVAIVFMLLAGMNFALHFHVWHQRSLRPYVADVEVRAYLTMLAAVAVLIVTGLWLTATYADFSDALLHGAFHAVSIATTTGFTTTGFHWWPLSLPILLLTASFIGGCANSTAGGIKVIRMLLIMRQGRREIFRLIHPAAIRPIKLGGKIVSDQVIQAVWGFFALYVLSFGILALALTTTGLDWVTAFSAVTACLNNLGPGVGGVAESFAGINDAGKWILAFAMLLGRLELFTLLVLFTPTFWRS